ncbi:MAG: hypothetical protein ACI8X5_004031 [Planctomycetota bacterium]|jgi:hypothetical protein
MMKPYRFRLGLALAGIAVAITVMFTSCSSTIPRRDPMGQIFPSVEGESLEGESVRLPTDMLGKPALLLIGYRQNTQFDLDRWILGLMQVQTPIRIFEVPTIPGLVPGMIAGTIDNGMRSGIPMEDWAIVVTLYGKNARGVAEWTGTEDGLNGRIVLLDAEGRAVWFHDRGYSATHLLDLDRVIRELEPPAKN